MTERRAWSGDAQLAAFCLRNGVWLTSLYDKTFDRGLVTFSDDLKVVISSGMRAQTLSKLHQRALLGIKGIGINLPARFTSYSSSLSFRREHIFDRAYPEKTTRKAVTSAGTYYISRSYDFNCCTDFVSFR